MGGNVLYLLWDIQVVWGLFQANIDIWLSAIRSVPGWTAFFFFKHNLCLLEKPECPEKTTQIQGQWANDDKFDWKTPQKPWKISHRNPTQITTLHIPNQHYRRKHSSTMSSSTKRQVVWSSSSSSSPSPLAQCLLKIKGHLKLQPYFRMHNNSDNSGECHLPHVVESTDIVLLLSALLTEDSDVLFSPDSKLNTHKKRLECYSCKCHHI